MSTSRCSISSRPSRIHQPSQRPQQGREDTGGKKVGPESQTEPVPGWTDKLVVPAYDWLRAGALGGRNRPASFGGEYHARVRLLSEGKGGRERAARPLSRDAQGKMATKAYLGFLCNDCLDKCRKPGSTENHWLLKQVGLE